MEWALRDYGNRTQAIWDGNPNCKHEWGKEIIRKQSGGTNKSNITNFVDDRIHFKNRSSFCKKCKAWRGQLGLEPAFDLYIKHLCDIFDEVKRVLKFTGTCWVNLGDTYSGSGCGTNDYRTEASKSIQGIGKNIRLYKTGGIAQKIKEVPAKSLCLIPFRFAIEMVNRGWTVRNVIIWHKPNCMPSSVKDRFTVDFEYIFFFVKNKKYRFETQYESWKDKNKHDIERAGKFIKYEGKHKDDSGNKGVVVGNPLQGRNKRCVWTVPTKPFSEAHFATYPPRLCETPIKSGCPQNGIVLDPFMGGGTTGLAANKLGVNFIGIEVNPRYIEMARKRMGQISK
jgi:site-specific DNA-methyltransferase (adenine-specific)